ncbi:Ku domain protein [Myxococcus hansupus]|uniref:Ku domain protein n=1 Tax=Pseudomyxococcus hansupus TaxID=1297742 RepID=A0A0H4X2D7_9BACT|nr:EF-hand domain-containing protein [Myxococcus hansupus]AKQ67820.1 Ku domain protein [Myxococcus hansupus]
MATKSRKTAVAKKSSRRGSTAKKAASKKAAKKATAKKAAPKKSAAKKAPARKKSTAKKVSTRKAPAKKAAAKKVSARKAPAKKAAAKKAPARKPSAARKSTRSATGSSFVEQVETTSAGLQPLAPVHAPVDEFTSTGNEVLDIFQRYDRDRTGTIDRAEFARLLEALGQNISDEELEIAIDIVDTDRTGKISWNEFRAWWNSR